MPRCTISNELFSVSDLERSLLERFSLPLPTWSPLERRRLRLAYRNQRRLYRRTCAATGKSLISVFPPEFPGSVVSLNYWWSDEWDARSWGREFDFTRPFFEQFGELFHAAPLPSSMVNNCENCEYNAYCAVSRNCYLCQSSAESENVCYTYGPTRCRDSMECHNIADCELCYEVIHGGHCYDVQESKNVEHCRESAFLLNCRNCRNCFMCANLRNAQYCFRNKQLTRAAYEQAIAPFQMMTRTTRRELREEFFATAAEQPYPALWEGMNEDATGNYIFNSKGIANGFDIQDGEDIAHGSRLYSVKTAADADFVFQGEELYQFLSGNRPSRCRFSFSIYDGSYDVEYSASCASGCHHLFGCVGLRRAAHCIFNCEYRPEEFHKLRARIIAHMQETGEWGHFFPPSLSPFPYNDTVAQDFYPLTEEDARQRGFQWTDHPPEEQRSAAAAAPLPEDSREATEDILRAVYCCEQCQRAYKIQGLELQLAQKLFTSLPLRCFDCRYRERLSRLEPLTLFERSCTKCSAPITTALSPERPEPVLCEKCYHATLY